jgi:hypothetical protein
MMKLGCVWIPRSGARSRKSFKKWWPETGSNRRRRPFQGRALPLSYLALGGTKGDCEQSLAGVPMLQPESVA